jgi:membrane-bound ClpP family serine protease
VAIDLIVQHIRDLLNSENCTQFELAEGLVPLHTNNVNASRLH